MEGFVPEDDSVRLLSYQLQDLDYTKLYLAYSAKGRNPAVDPKTMFKILTYAYSQNIYSSRKIEKACKRDINFMWLLAGQRPPDHSTIARFRTGFLAGACEDLFYQMVRNLAAMGELGKETVFIDGTKLEACANKYTFVWKKSVGKWEEKMFAKITQAVDLVNREYIKDFFIEKGSRDKDLQRVFDFLDSYCKEQGIKFVYGRGKHKSNHQKYHELFRRFLDRQLLNDLHNSRFHGRNSYSKTDIDATFMHMKDECDKKRLLLEIFQYRKKIIYYPSDRDIPIRNCVTGNCGVGCMRKSLIPDLASIEREGKGKICMVCD